MIPFIVLYLKSQHHPLSSPAGSAPEVCAAFLTRCKYGSKPDDLDISAQTYRAAPSKQVFQSFHDVYGTISSLGAETFQPESPACRCLDTLTDRKKFSAIFSCRC